jgi:hypothetical protein
VTKSTSERLLEERAKAGSAIAAVELARVLARKDREHRKPNLTQVRAEIRDAAREATSVSRAKTVLGPDTPEGFAERTLAWLLDDDPSPEFTAQVDAEHEALRAAQLAEPDHLDRSPAEIARQAAQDAQQRDVQAWMRAELFTNNPPPENN